VQEPFPERCVGVGLILGACASEASHFGRVRVQCARVEINHAVGCAVGGQQLLQPAPALHAVQRAFVGIRNGAESIGALRIACGLGESVHNGARVGFGDVALAQPARQRQREVVPRPLAVVGQHGGGYRCERAGAQQRVAVHIVGQQFAVDPFPFQPVAVDAWGYNGLHGGRACRFGAQLHMRFPLLGVRNRARAAVEVVRDWLALLAHAHARCGEQIRRNSARFGGVQVHIHQPARNRAQPNTDIAPVILFGVTESAVGVVPAADFHGFGAWLDGNRIESQFPVNLEPLMGYTSVRRIAPLRAPKSSKSGIYSAG
jgi:hypothetical protein